MGKAVAFTAYFVSRATQAVLTVAAMKGVGVDIDFSVATVLSMLWLIAVFTSLAKPDVTAKEAEFWCYLGHWSREKVLKAKKDREG